MGTKLFLDTLEKLLHFLSRLKRGFFSVFIIYKLTLSLFGSRGYISFHFPTLTVVSINLSRITNMNSNLEDIIPWRRIWSGMNVMYFRIKLILGVVDNNAFFVGVFFKTSMKHAIESFFLWVALVISTRRVVLYYWCNEFLYFFLFSRRIIFVSFLFRASCTYVLTFSRNHFFTCYLVSRNHFKYSSKMHGGAHMTMKEENPAQ